MSFSVHDIPSGSSVEDVAQQSTQETGNIIVGPVRPVKKVIRDVIDKPMDKENRKFIIGAFILYMFCKK